MVHYSGLRRKAVGYMHEFWKVYTVAFGGVLKQGKLNLNIWEEIMFEKVLSSKILTKFQ
jgi:hypothetical protein